MVCAFRRRHNRSHDRVTVTRRKRVVPVNTRKSNGGSSSVFVPGSLNLTKLGTKRRRHLRDVACTCLLRHSEDCT